MNFCAWALFNKKEPLLGLPPKLGLRNWNVIFPAQVNGEKKHEQHYCMFNTHDSLRIKNHVLEFITR